MKLSSIILDNIEPILQEWEDFAKNIFPKNRTTTVSELRDHAKKILMLIVNELEYEFAIKGPDKNIEELILSSRGEKDTPSKIHGFARMHDGFNINELVSEYRALRASVIKIFNNSVVELSTSRLKELAIFNEAIDRSLAESISSYSYFEDKQINLFNGMLSVNPDLHYILDLNGNILYMNLAMNNFYEKPAYEILGKAIYNFAMPTVSEVHECIQYVIKTLSNCRGEVTYKSDSGNDRFFQYTYGPIFDKNGKVDAIAGTSREITEQKIVEKQIWINANYDSLTGLANRLRFHDKLKQALKHSKRSGESLALLFIDLDLFKNINDNFGHENGDRVLNKVARCIKSCVREADTVARMGGDEFIVLLLDIKGIEQAEIIAKKILSKTRKPFNINKNSIQTSVSIGITISPKDGIKPDELLNNSDQAMYAAKKAGKDCFSFYSGCSK